jgi:hypothetical protein
MTKDQKNQAIELLFEVYDCGQQSKTIDLIGYLDDIVRALNIADVGGNEVDLCENCDKRPVEYCICEDCLRNPNFHSA